MISIDFTTIASTGTVGSTLTSDGVMDGIIGIDLSDHIITIGIILPLFIIAHLLDRKYSRPMFDRECT